MFDETEEPIRQSQVVLSNLLQLTLTKKSALQAKQARLLAVLVKLAHGTVLPWRASDARQDD